MEDFILKYRSEEPFTAEAIRHIREGLLHQCLENGLKQEECWDIASIFDELCCNMIDHGRASWIEVEIQAVSGQKARMIVRDNGIPFDPSSEADLPSNYERGIGLQMIHQQAKELKYRRHPDGINELALVPAA